MFEEKKYHGTTDLKTMATDKIMRNDDEGLRNNGVLSLLPPGTNLAPLGLLVVFTFLIIIVFTTILCPFRDQFFIGFILSWIEISIGFAEYFISSAILHSTRFFIFGEAGVFGCIIDFISVSIFLCWTNSIFFGCSVVKICSNIGLRSHISLTSFRAIFSIFLFHGSVCFFASFFGMFPSANYSWDLVGLLRNVLLTPAREEILYRVILLTRMQNRFPHRPIASARCAALFFGFAHFSNLSNPKFGPGYVTLQVLFAVCVGYLLSLQFLNRHCFPEILACHILNNCFASLFPMNSLISLQNPITILVITITAVFYSYRIYTEGRNCNKMTPITFSSRTSKNS